MSQKEIEQAVKNGLIDKKDVKNWERSYRIRNYSAMTDYKLMRVIEELEGTPKGEAYYRSLQRGSGDPEFDLIYALNIAEERGLITR